MKSLGGISHRSTWSTRRKWAELLASRSLREQPSIHGSEIVIDGGNDPNRVAWATPMIAGTLNRGSHERVAADARPRHS